MRKANFNSSCTTCAAKPSFAKPANGSTRTFSQEGAYFMMVLSYWDQACAYLNHGLLHEQLFFETSGEFFGVWERLKSIVPGARKAFHQKLFAANLEKAAHRFEKWLNKESPGSIEAMREFMQQMRSAKTQKAGA
jgi:hypothetical protein